MHRLQGKPSYSAFTNSTSQKATHHVALSHYHHVDVVADDFTIGVGIVSAGADHLGRVQFEHDGFGRADTRPDFTLSFDVEGVLDNANIRVCKVG